MLAAIALVNHTQTNYSEMLALIYNHITLSITAQHIAVTSSKSKYMKRKTIIIFLLLSYITVSSYAQQSKVNVTYVGNAGFLINIGDKKILIDALFKGFEGNYQVPLEVQNKLAKAQIPFDDVDLILVTHAHGDHIDLDMVRQHMQSNPSAIFASTQQLVDALNDSTDRWIGFSPTKEKSDSKVISDISVEAFYLPHGPNARIINIGFLISVNGITIFQTGDADFDQFTFEEFRSLQLPERKIDLSFIQHYYLRGDSLNTKFVTEAIGGKYIFPIHYHFTTPVFDSIIIRQNYPDAIIFNEELDTWKMPAIETTMQQASPKILIDPKGDYLGQTLPGYTPEVFARGLISTDHLEHSAPIFSPDGTEVFWSLFQRPEVKGFNGKLNKRMRQVDGQWTIPTKADKLPAFTLDGTQHFLIANIPLTENNKINANSYDRSHNLNYICLLERFPELRYTRMLSIADNRTIYFVAYLEGPLNEYGIYRSELINGEYANPEPLPSAINKMAFLNWTPFIAPDESYLLFSSNRHDPENDAGDIYISYHSSDGSWSEPVNIGAPVNTNYQERFPVISPDGRFLFFTRPTPGHDQDVYWVSAELIKGIGKNH